MKRKSTLLAIIGLLAVTPAYASVNATIDPTAKPANTMEVLQLEPLKADIKETSLPMECRGFYVRRSVRQTADFSRCN